MTAPTPAPPRRSRRLVVRIYLGILAFLVVVGGSLLLLERYVVGTHDEAVRGLGHYVLHKFAEKLGTPAALQADLDEIDRDLGGALVFYDGDGHPLASTPRLLPPLPPDELQRLGRTGDLRLGRRSVATRVGEHGGKPVYGLLSLPSHSSALEEAAWAVGVVLIFLVIASILFARALLEPLGKLAAAARALGEGDLTARVGLERTDEIGEVARTFDEMAERVGRLVLAQKELLANVSHELRTPLSRIRVALDIATEGDTARARESMGDIAQDLAELERLVDDILTAARLELSDRRVAAERATPLRLESVDAAALVTRAAARFRAAHPARALEVEAAAGLVAIEADPMLLRRVIDNLLDNADKHSDAAGPIVLRARDEAETLVVEVVDRGDGIAAEDRDRLFTPFFRGDKSRTRATGGVGLGLTLARRIVEAHRGSIELESAPGVGTTARFTVPRKPMDRDGVR